MLTLYSFGPGANSLKPMLTLYEKGLEFEIVRLNPAKFEHHEDWFKAINPNGQVPALVDDGKVITESDGDLRISRGRVPDRGQAAPRRQLRPRADAGVDQVGRRIFLLVRLDDRLGPRMISRMARAISDEEFEEQIKRIPIPEQQTKWRNARAGFPQACSTRRCARSASRCAGSRPGWQRTSGSPAECITLADICNFAIANGMQFGFAELVNPSDTPHLVRWIEQINARPAAKRMFAEVPFERLDPEEAA